MLMMRALMAALLAFAVAGLAHAAPAENALAPGPHTFDSSGVRLWYRVAGTATGEPVVFLHGGPGEGSQTFAKYAGPELERSLRMVYLDQRGAGRSDRPKAASAYSIPIMVEDIEALRQRLGAQRIALVAHSFGTILALEYAAAHPEHVSRVVLASAVPDFPADLELMCARLEHDDPQAFDRAKAAVKAGAALRCDPFAAYPDATKAYVYRNMFPDPATGRLVDAADDADGLTNTGESSAALFAEGLTNYRFKRPDAVTAPVLIVAGAEDHQTWAEPQRALAAALPNARIVVLTGHGHFMFVEDPAGFAHQVVPFLRPETAADAR